VMGIARLVGALNMQQNPKPIDPMSANK